MSSGSCSGWLAGRVSLGHELLLLPKKWRKPFHPKQMLNWPYITRDWKVSMRYNSLHHANCFLIPFLCPQSQFVRESIAWDGVSQNTLVNGEFELRRGVLKQAQKTCCSSWVCPTSGNVLISLMREWLCFWKKLLNMQKSPLRQR